MDIYTEQILEKLDVDFCMIIAEEVTYSRQYDHVITTRPVANQRTLILGVWTGVGYDICSIEYIRIPKSDQFKYGMTQIARNVSEHELFSQVTSRMRYEFIQMVGMVNEYSYLGDYVHQLRYPDDR